MIKYIGDISEADARLLRDYARGSEKILEFGCGASTQVLAKYCTHLIHSIDTSPDWIDKTKKNLDLFSLKDFVLFESYDAFLNHPNIYTVSGTFDFVFDDGVDHLRREFAIKIWPYIEVGGVLAFHDTRRPADMDNVLAVIRHYMDEVAVVRFNEDDSNITTIRKKKAAPYTNWQIDEKKEPWQLGYGDPPQEFIDSLKKTN